MLWVAISLYVLGALLAAATAMEYSGTIRGLRQVMFILAWPGVAIAFAIEALVRD